MTLLRTGNSVADVFLAIDLVDGVISRVLQKLERNRTYIEGNARILSQHAQNSKDEATNDFKKVPRSKILADGKSFVLLYGLSILLRVMFLISQRHFQVLRISRLYLLLFAHGPRLSRKCAQLIPSSKC